MEKLLIIKTENCPQNHKCPAIKVCPVGALSQIGFEAPLIDSEKCIKCGKCSKFCPKKALILQNGSIMYIIIHGLIMCFGKLTKTL